MTGAVKEALDRAEANLSYLALFQRVQACLPWWEQHGVPEVLHLLLQGIGEGQPLPPLLSLADRYKSPTEVQAATLILEGYQKEGAVRQLPGGGCQTLGALVYHFQAREWDDQTQTDFRLQGAEQLLSASQFQVGQCPTRFCPTSKKVGGLQSWI